MLITITVRDRQYESHIITVQGKNEVCPRCRGSGHVVNPNVDGNGLSAEDFAADPDFEEAYFAGHYDIRCPECGGNRVVPVPNVKALSYSQLRQWVRELNCQHEDAKYAAECRAERRAEMCCLR